MATANPVAISSTPSGRPTDFGHPGTATKRATSHIASPNVSTTTAGGILSSSEGIAISGPQAAVAILARPRGEARRTLQVRQQQGVQLVTGAFVRHAQDRGRVIGRHDGDAGGAVLQPLG